MRCAQDKSAISRLYRGYVGQKAVIVGNGPSLQVEKLAELKGYVAFGFNKIFLAYPQTTWRPDFYLVCDRLVAQQNSTEIRALESRKIFSSGVWEELGDDEEALFVAPGSSAAWEVSEPSLLSPDGGKELWVPPDWNPLAGMRAGNSVTNFALKMAFWMGFQEVYVLGLDHKFSLDKEIAGERLHGGSVLESDGEIRNHFSADYRQPFEKWTFPKLDLMSREFDRAREVYESVSRRIVNATPSSAYQGWEFGSIPDVATARTSVQMEHRERLSISGPKHPKISAIITAFNAEGTLGRAIDSALNQSNPLLEVIVVNDASSDSTAAVADEYARNFPKVVKVIHHAENKGQGHAFVSAFCVASGEYFSLLDSDDYWDSDKAQKLVSQILSDRDSLLFQQNLRVVDETKKTSSNRPFREYLVSGDITRFFREETTLGRFVPTSGITVARGIVSELYPDILDFRISADGFLTRVAARLGPFSSVSTPSGAYAITGLNSTFNNPNYSQGEHRQRLRLALEKNYARAGRVDLLPASVAKSFLVAVLSSWGRRLWRWLNS